MDLAFPTEDTIAAIASAVSPGEGAIAVIKVSGKSSKTVVKNIVRVPGEQLWTSHKILYGHVIDQTTKKVIDEVLVSIFKNSLETSLSIPGSI